MKKKANILKREDRTQEKLVPPLTFRLYQRIKFNRPVDFKDDFVSPGGYELTMVDEDGMERDVQFDFEDYEGNISVRDPQVVCCMQKNPDFDSFEGLDTVTEYMLRHVTGVKEWFVYTGEPGEQEEPLIPIGVDSAEFEIITDSTGRDIPRMRIPITVRINPVCGFGE